MSQRLGLWNHLYNFNEVQVILFEPAIGQD